MSEATDVLRAIDQLRRDLSGYHGQLKAHDDLQRHCDNQRKRIVELEGLYAGAKAEVAELKEQTIWMARWEMAVRAREQAKADSAELRELVRVFALWERDGAAMCRHGKCPIEGECGDHDDCMFVDWAIDRARELGAEV